MSMRSSKRSSFCRLMRTKELKWAPEPGPCWMRISPASARLIIGGACLIRFISFREESCLREESRMSNTQDHTGPDAASVLVTGGAGFIGSHTCKLLAAHGQTPVTYDNLSRGHADVVKWGPLIKGDVLDFEEVNKAFERHKPKSVIHFAALAYVGESVSHPLAYYKNNVSGLINVLDAMVHYGVRTIVFSSSCATYGVPKSLPITEDSPQEPISPYGRSKLIC